MMKYYVYEYVDPRTHEVIYVGKGSGNRCHSHLIQCLNETSTTNPLKYNKIKKILKSGLQPIIKKVFFTNDETEAYDKETMLIEQYGRIDLGTGTLTNAKCGGEDGRNPSSITRKKMSVSHTGVKRGPHTEETKRKIGLANSSKARTNEQKMHQSKIMSGRKVSNETKQKMSKSHTGKQMSNETKNKISKSNSGKNNGMYGKSMHKGKKRMHQEDGTYYMMKPETT